MFTILLAATAVLTPIYATSSSREVRVPVGHADLDLSTADGRARLDRRIARAADQACGTPSSVDLAGKSAAARCRQMAVAAVADQRTALTDAPLIIAASRR